MNMITDHVFKPPLHAPRGDSCDYRGAVSGIFCCKPESGHVVAQSPAPTDALIIKLWERGLELEQVREELAAAYRIIESMRTMADNIAGDRNLFERQRNLAWEDLRSLRTDLKNRLEQR